MSWYFVRQILRGINRNRFNSFVKALGITLALISGMLIWSFVQHEKSYDRDFPGFEKIFRVVRNWQEDVKYGAYTPVPLLSALSETFPEIETGTRIWPLYGQNAKVGNRIYNEEMMLAADSSFFNTFGIQLFAGDVLTALSTSGSVIISKSTASKLYGTDDPIGRIIEFEGNAISERNRIFTVKGIFDDFPSNSHLKANYILSLRSFNISIDPETRNHQLMTYLRLNNPADERLIEQKLPKFMESFYGKEYFTYARSTYLLQPVTDIHLNTTVNYNGYETAQGSYSNIYIYPTLVLLILLISSFNFVNLTVSEGASRHKAFGINKIMGAGHLFFFKHYIFESLVLTLFALIVTFFLLSIIYPMFTEYVERDLNLNFYNNPFRVGAVLIFALVIGVINGIYPASFYSRKNLFGFLKDNPYSSGKQFNVQRMFQVLQFVICIFLIVISFMVFKQLNFINAKINESIDSENVMVINNADRLGIRQDVFKEELGKISGIQNASYCNEVPGIEGYSHWGHPVDSALYDVHIAVFNCDYNYLSTLNMKLTEGRFFNPGFATDNRAMVLNETAVKTLGWEASPLGKRYRLQDTFTVVGVVKDIYFESFHHEIIPQGFFLKPPNSGGRILIKIQSEETPDLMLKIKQLWTRWVPDNEILYNFLNEDFDSWYRNERKTGQLAFILTTIAIFLSNLGLLALVLLSIHRKTKEIGIRKVNGARVWQILYLLNLKYMKWVTAAFLIACPLAWIAAYKWLQNFAYKTELNWWIFAIGGLMTLVIAILTVSWQSWRAASRNPVEALRYE